MRVCQNKDKYGEKKDVAVAKKKRKTSRRWRKKTESEYRVEEGEKTKMRKRIRKVVVKRRVRRGQWHLHSFYRLCACAKGRAD
jgi:hypothetical protein